MTTTNYTIIAHGGSGDWSVLYDADGKLVTYGDTSSVIETLFEKLGVEQDQNYSVIRKMDDGSKYGTERPASSLAELDEWTAEDQAARDKVTALRAEADKLEKKLRR